MKPGVQDLHVWRADEPTKPLLLKLQSIIKKMCIFGTVTAECTCRHAYFDS